MKAKIRMLVFAIIVIGLAVVYAVIDKAEPIFSSDIDNSQYIAGNIPDDSEIVQQFIGNTSKIDGISLKLKHEGKTQKSILYYELKDVDNSKVVARGEILASQLKNGKFFKIKFDEITKSEGKTFTITLRVKENNEGEKWEFFYVSEVSQGLRLIIDDKQIDGTMILRIITHKFDIETFIVTIFFGVYIVLFMGWLNRLFK